MQIIRNEINVPSKHLKILKDEFKKSRQTIFNALKDITQSELAKDIRARAKELLIEEANQI
jgi:transcriptional regulator of met regulon